MPSVYLEQWFSSEYKTWRAFQASFLPLSIIIVGVGEEEFDSMDELDSDDSLLAFEGRQAQRDIVQVAILWVVLTLMQEFCWISSWIQFIPLRLFLRAPVTGMDGERVMELLAKEVLAEVPLQLTSYMELNRITPKLSDGKTYYLSRKVISIKKLQTTAASWRWALHLAQKPTWQPTRIQLHLRSLDRHPNKDHCDRLNFIPAKTSRRNYIWPCWHLFATWPVNNWIFKLPLKSLLHLVCTPMKPAHPCSLQPRSN